MNTKVKVKHIDQNDIVNTILYHLQYGFDIKFSIGQQHKGYKVMFLDYIGCNKPVTYHKNSVYIDIPVRKKIEIILTAIDTYTVRLWYVGSKYNTKILKEVKEVYADKLTDTVLVMLGLG